MTLLSATLVAIAALSGIEVPLVADPEILLDGHDLQVKDVIDMSAVPPELRSRIAGMELLDLSESKGGQVSISAADLSAMIRKRVPALDVRSNGPAVYSIRVWTERQALVAGDIQLCSVMALPVRADRIIEPSDIESIACDAEKVRASVYFDRQYSVLRAGKDLRAGDYLGRVEVPGQTSVDIDDELVFTFRKGPVAVRRPVRALQVGRSEQKLFVRTGDGKVLSVEYRENENTGTD